MKAIIMAGGEGSRLRPLTCGRPKPMVPVLNRPIMVHIVELLKEHGITDIGVTLQYQPEAIRDYFADGEEYGVNLQYFVEDVPLGTAGSVKNAADFLDETFVVISGDALTDLELSRAVEFHKKRGSIATLVLTRVDCPLEYGVVITGKDGKINQFLEKPGWGEVFSDTVNTGIYVLEPEVLAYFAPGQKFDFSQDLFPLLLRNQKPLFGLVLPGYWCDIGNLQQYLGAHHDALSGKVKIKMPGTEILPRVWVEESVSIDSGASIEGPALIGAGCGLSAGVRIEPLTVLGNGCLLQERASIKRSVLWSNVYIGNNTALRGAIVCSRVQVHANSGIYEGAVVGDDSIIQENSLLKPDVKLWPHKLVETGATVQRSLIWGTCSPKKYFGFEGISGIINVEITPEFAAMVGAAFGSISGTGARLAVCSDNYAASLMIKKAVISGLQSTGAAILDLGTGITPMLRYAVRSLECNGGVHAKISHLSPDRVTLVFTDSRGGNISRGTERKVENALAREDFTRTEVSRIIPPVSVQDMPRSYLSETIAGLNTGMLRNARYKLLLSFDRNNLAGFVTGLAEELGFSLENYWPEKAGNKFHGWHFCQEILSSIAFSVVESGFDAGAVLDSNADRLILIDDKGQIIQGDLLTALISLIILKEQKGPVVVPVTAPQTIEALAERYKGRVVRTKTTIQDFLYQILIQEDLGGVSQFSLHFDAFSALVKILDYIAQHRILLSELITEIPSFFTDKKEVPVPWETKGRVIRRLIQEPSSGRLELLDGVKVFHQDGWALVLPDPDKPVCRVFSEGSTMEIAESLTDMYIKKIGDITESIN
ncbi:MAG: D-glycero-alpha-D-manno-heptose 1-phosphate guanylyltransferase [Pelotomaculum sp. PtaU1.Bin035]|nr:MAG: D-glycero-alpha-D-manno-heptose 1-phosphate guanylyltransferase [Pelotomaculum sp. PtaU1.Bin035]